jgi:raffinose/stachyose/melibiose transport system permease protein
MFAAVVISIIPSITVFILFQEKVINGLTAGSVKG